jgi:hypothetical protein
MWLESRTYLLLKTEAHTETPKMVSRPAMVASRMHVPTEAAIHCYLLLRLEYCRIQTYLLVIELEHVVAVSVAPAHPRQCAAWSDDATTIDCTRPFYRDSNCGGNLFGGPGARRDATC